MMKYSETLTWMLTGLTAIFSSLLFKRRVVRAAGGRDVTPTLDVVRQSAANQAQHGRNYFQAPTLVPEICGIRSARRRARSRTCRFLFRRGSAAAEFSSRPWRDPPPE